MSQLDLDSISITLKDKGIPHKVEPSSNAHVLDHHIELQQGYALQIGAMDPYIILIKEEEDQITKVKEGPLEELISLYQELIS